MQTKTSSVIWKVFNYGKLKAKIGYRSRFSSALTFHNIISC
jgi:hypothetical protein